jgi:hypothetical protein
MWKVKRVKLPRESTNKTKSNTNQIKQVNRPFVLFGRHKTQCWVALGVKCSRFFYNHTNKLKSEPRKFNGAKQTNSLERNLKCSQLNIKKTLHVLVS